MDTQTELRRLQKPNTLVSLESVCVIDLCNWQQYFLVGIRPSETEPHNLIRSGQNEGSCFLYQVDSSQVNTLFLQRLLEIPERGFTPLNSIEYKPSHFLHNFDIKEDKTLVRRVIDTLRKEYSHP